MDPSFGEGRRAPPGDSLVLCASEGSDFAGRYEHRVLILESNRLYSGLIRQALASALPNASVIAASSVAEAKKAVDGRQCDLMIAGLVAEDDDVLEAVREWRDSKVHCAMIVTSHGEAAVLNELALLGVPVVFDETTEDLHAFGRTAQWACHGGRYWSPRFCQELKRHLNPTSVFSSLSPTERMVLGVIGDGKDDARASVEIGLSAQTVKTVRREIHRKLGVQHKGELIDRAAEYGFAIKTSYGYFRPGLMRLMRNRQGRGQGPEKRAA